VPSDFRATLAGKSHVTDALSCVCKLCARGERVQHLEGYRHKEIPQILALFCPKCGGLFRVEVGEGLPD